MGMGVVNFDECRCFYAVSLNGHDPYGEKKKSSGHISRCPEEKMVVYYLQLSFVSTQLPGFYE